MRTIVPVPLNRRPGSRRAPADPVALGVALFVYGAVASLPSPAIAAYIADVVPGPNRQRAYTLQSWAISFGYAIGPIIANQLVKVSYSLMFGYFIAYFQSTSSLPIAMTNFGMGTDEYSVLLSVNGGMLCLLQIPMMKLFKRMGNSRVLVGGWIISHAGGRTLWIICTAVLALVTVGLAATRASRDRESARSLHEIEV